MPSNLPVDRDTPNCVRRIGRAVLQERPRSRICQDFSSLLTVLILAGLALGSAHARSTADQSNPCRSNCDIQLVPVVTLSDASHPGLLPDTGPIVSSDNSGRYFLASADRTRLIVFNTDGRIARLVDGGAGGAFQSVTGVLTAPDGTLVVYDILTRTLSRFDRNLKPIDARAFQARPMLLLPGDRYLHAGQIRTPEHVGQPLHILDHSGRILSSFGSTDETFRADQPLRYERRAAPSHDGTIWSAHFGRYALERWDPKTRTKVAEIVVASSWFRESMRWQGPREKPVPLIQAVWEEADLLWILLRDADPKWNPEELAGEHPIELHWLERNWDSVLEAVSLKTGDVIASRRFDRALWGLAPQLLLTSRTKGATAKSGSQVEVWRPRLVQKRGRS